MRRARLLPLAVGVMLLAAGASGAERTRRASDGRYVMGTVLEIQLELPEAGDGRAALERLFGIAAELDARLTVYDPESAVSRLNRRAGQGAQPVDPELAAILAEARRYGRLTRGSFDVTVGPLVALWTQAARRDRLPTPAELAEARSRVGWQKLRVSLPATAELPKPGMSVDLGGIAKGYALDRMRAALDQAGLANAFLNFGGSSLLGLGTPAGGGGWRALLDDASDGYAGVVTLRDRALSVSGSLGQWSEIGGRRYGHVLDPRSGQPLVRARQAAIVARSGALAEALSKALLILGEEEGVALVESQPGAEGLLLDADGSVWRTSGWNEAVAFEDWTRPRRAR